MSNNISATALAGLFLKPTWFIDVRAPVEFAQGSLPGAVNLPIMDDHERAAVGTTYKEAGREAALALGHQLVSGKIKEERVQAWRQHLQKHPETILYCFRGGLRSQITQRWLAEVGLQRPLIEGGYKAARTFLREEMDRVAAAQEFLMLSGPTGSAKTHLLGRALEFYPGLDLEALARHRGSAFGGTNSPQPSQVDFENQLAVGLLRLVQKPLTAPVLLEDESRLIGRCAMPETFFLQMRSSRVVYVEQSFEQRVENIFQDYVVHSALGQGSEAEALALFAQYRRAAQAISRKLGGLRTEEVLQELAHSEEEFCRHQTLESNKGWIAKLLSYYYDPLYASSFEKRGPTVAFRGSPEEVLEYLRNLRAGC